MKNFGPAYNGDISKVMGKLPFGCQSLGAKGVRKPPGVSLRHFPSFLGGAIRASFTPGKNIVPEEKLVMPNIQYPKGPSTS